MMKPNLLYEAKEHSLQMQAQAEQLLQDLHVEPILNAMARKDQYVYSTAKTLLLDTLSDENTIMYRQQILADILHNPSLIQQLYGIANAIILQSADYQTQMKPNFSRNVPVSEKLKTSAALLPSLLAKLQELRDLGASHRPHCQSQGLTALFRQLEQTYTNGFLSEARTHCKLLQQTVQQCKLNIGARIGDGLKGTGVTLRKLEGSASFSLNMLRLGKADSLHFGHSLKEIEESALINVLRIVNRFIDESLAFINMLRFESSFYVGCMHLHGELAKCGCEVAFPQPLPSDGRVLSFIGIYDPSLALSKGRAPVANEMHAEEMRLLVITGANQGGKTTFLRSVGLAQLMMQCGMFVPAAAFQASLCDQIFTHFTREEDETMHSGKLDEEVARLDQMIDHLTSRSLLLMNEPFASTTERDGTAIAKDLLSVCYELKLRVCIVTHFYELAGWATGQFEHAVFLSPDRGHKETGTYRLSGKKPSPTSYGEDLYERIIGAHVSRV
ncbi:hypothetical protein EBB07_23900 [Paenibacillaceae bacterium]|nr:hypothetical protein EBB07_23900 [Paenibacillaceae bacterium]